MSYDIERCHDISCGHRVHGHESKCAHLHGHNYRMTFRCIPGPKPEPRKFIGSPETEAPGELDSIGRVIDFSVVKSELCMWIEDNWDHKFLIWEHDPMRAALVELDPAGVVRVIEPFGPVTEIAFDTEAI